MSTSLRDIIDLKLDAATQREKARKLRSENKRLKTVACLFCITLPGLELFVEYLPVGGIAVHDQKAKTTYLHGFHYTGKILGAMISFQFNCKGERSAFAFCAFHCDLAVHGLNQLPGDGQAQSGAAVFSRC